MRRHKVFTRTRLIAEIAPRLYGHDPAQLDHVIDRVLAPERWSRSSGSSEPTSRPTPPPRSSPPKPPSPKSSAGSPTAPDPTVLPGEVDEAIEVAEHRSAGT